MATKLSRFADGIMEAAWLAALIVVPAFFNVYSSRIFEPDKIGLLRSLALVVLAAWLIKLLEEGRPPAGILAGSDSRIRALFRVPLLMPVAALAAIYILSTLLSVAPRISLIGSYQRLQGTYSTFSYLVIFAAMAANLRRSSQVNRVITTAILVSLPVSMYGVLQRFQIDPVPWAGNVTRRIASNMGNAIFVAAYLIMVSPLTIGRIASAFRAILSENAGSLTVHFIRGTTYVFIAALQIIAIYLSRSRGPLLGLLAAWFFLFILLSLYWRKRWLTFGTVGMAAVLGVFLVVLNVPGGPLEPLREAPWLGRLGKVFDTEQRTSQVRVLIWDGAADLVAPHEPLDFPDGSTDSLNLLRPLIGYGPESMHVAYNKFFPPELARLEKRNASPDRSHNETWDTLVTTGVLGLGSYLVLFTAIFYYGLRWLGLLTGPRDRWLFLSLFFGGGLISTIGFVLVMGTAFLGVGLPFGMILGFTLYLAIRAFSARETLPSEGIAGERPLLLMAILAAIQAHFVEINFGIAIAATRTYFWELAALLLLVGYVLPRHGEYAMTGAQTAEDPGTEQNRPLRRGGPGKRRRSGRRQASRGRPWLRNSLVGGLLVGLLLMTLGYDFLNVRTLPTNTLRSIWESFTTLPDRDGATSFGVLALILVVWLAGCLLYFSESRAQQAAPDWMGLPVMMAVSLALALLFWAAHASALIGIGELMSGKFGPVDAATQSLLFERLLTRFFVFLLLTVVVAAGFLPADWPVPLMDRMGLASFIAPTVWIAAVVLAVFTNLRVIHADIAFKLAGPLAAGGQWEPALAIYGRSNEFAPAEDHYYLFRGKTYLDSAQTINNAAQRDQRVGLALDSLQKAQDLNPLNTDHTANLARLYRWWATATGEASLALDRGNTSSNYYARALKLSPNNVVIWGEWASLYLTTLNRIDLAYDRLTTALEIDPQFAGTHALLGDYSARLADQNFDNLEARRAALEQAAFHYSKALELTTANNAQGRQSRFSYLVALGGVFTALGETPRAIGAYQQAIDNAPNRVSTWQVEEVVATLYFQEGDLPEALLHANLALAGAPQNARQRIQNLISQIQNSP